MGMGMGVGLGCFGVVYVRSVGRKRRRRREGLCV